MKKNRSGIVYTALATILTFISVAYTSCKDKGKEAAPDYCLNVVCKNEGYCIKGACYCAAGYEGNSCEIKTTGKYEGKWDIADTIIYSTVVPSQPKSTYQVAINSVSTDVRQFAMNNFLGQYDGIVCQVPRADSFFFRENQAIASSKKILVEGGGKINQFASYFSGTYQVTYPATPEPIKETHYITAIRKD